MKFTCNFLAVSLVLLLLFSCISSVENAVENKIKKPNPTMQEASVEDTTRVLAVGLPINLDSTDVVFHPIGWENMQAVKSRKDNIIGRLKTSKGIGEPYYGSNFQVNTDNLEYIHGNIANIIIEDLKTGAQRLLSDSILKIESITYLKQLAKITKRHYLLYRIRDMDYNNDNKLNSNDLAGYYVSNMDGTNFTKIGKDHLLFEESKLLLVNQKYYFRAIEDVNQDNEFNENDKYCYYYVDFSSHPFKVKEYDPLSIITPK